MGGSNFKNSEVSRRSGDGESSLVAAPTGAISLSATAFDLSIVGYVAEEYFLAGNAVRYESVGECSSDGRWDARASEAAPFRTRIVVFRPAEARRQSGTVVVEWLNVSGNCDSAPDWMAAHRHLIRQGITWVGVTAQHVGIEGGGTVLPRWGRRGT